MHKVTGSLETLSAMQITAETAGLDVANKEILRHKEVLAVILKDTISEYKDYSVREIMEFIEPDSITSTKEVSTGRTNTEIHGENVEFVQLNEKTSVFDLYVKTKNPQLSQKDIMVYLHVDIEPQKDYTPGYPIEKRGIYYLARSLASQLTLITDNVNYSNLEKCYGIWICRDNIPEEERYSISFYSITNNKNIGNGKPKKEDYDLLTLVLIRLGSMEYDKYIDSAEGADVLEFLNAIMYPHQKDFMRKISKHIDFSNNEELNQEVKHMGGLGESILEEGIEQGIEKGIEQGKQEGIEALILDNLEEGKSEEVIIGKLVKRFHLQEEDAKAYYNRYVQ